MRCFWFKGGKKRAENKRKTSEGVQGTHKSSHASKGSTGRIRVRCGGAKDGDMVIMTGAAAASVATTADATTSVNGHGGGCVGRCGGCGGSGE